MAAPNYSVPSDPAATRTYPTSSKGPKDWSKVYSELAELEKKGELDDSDPLSSFFKKIFAQVTGTGGISSDHARLAGKVFRNNSAGVLRRVTKTSGAP